MTSNNTTSNDDYDGDGIDWDALAADVRAQAGLPLPAEVAPAADGLGCDCGSDVCLACALAPAGRIDIDPEADAELWPQVLDDKGRATGELARPEPAAMRAALYRASSVDPAEVDYLAEAVSPAEARAIIAQAARLREVERGLAAEVAERRAHLAAASERRQAEHEARLAEERRDRAATVETALWRRDRALDPTGRIVRLSLAERVVPAVAALPALAAAVIGTINVGAMLTELSPATTLINWAIEPLLTVPVIAILIAQVLGVIPHDGRSPYRRLEGALIVTTVALNVGLHVVVDGPTPAAAVWAIVPAGLAISVWLVPRLLRATRDALAEAADDAQRASQGAPAVAYSATWSTRPAGSPATRPAGSPQGVPALVGAGAGLTPLERLAEAVRTGMPDPGRVDGGPIDAASAASIARTLRIRKASAAELRDAYAAALEEVTDN